MAQRRCDWVVVEDNPLSPRAVASELPTPNATVSEASLARQAARAPQGPACSQPPAAAAAVQGPRGRGSRGVPLQRGMRGSLRGQRGRGRAQRGRGAVRGGHPPLRSTASAASVLELAGRGRGARSPPLRTSPAPCAALELATNAVLSEEVPVGCCIPKSNPSLTGMAGVGSRSASELPQHYRKPQPPGGRRLPPGMQKARSHSSPLPDTADRPSGVIQPPSGETPPNSSAIASKGAARARGGLVSRGRGMARGERLSPAAGVNRSPPLQVALAPREVPSIMVVSDSAEQVPPSIEVTCCVEDSGPADPQERPPSMRQPGDLPPSSMQPGVEQPGVQLPCEQLPGVEQRSARAPGSPRRSTDVTDASARAKSVEPQQRSRGGPVRGRGRGRGGRGRGLVFHRPVATRPGISPTPGRRPGAPPAVAGRGLLRSETAPSLRPGHSLTTPAPSSTEAGPPARAPSPQFGRGRPLSPCIATRPAVLQPAPPPGAVNTAAACPPAKTGHIVSSDRIASKSMPDIMSVAAVDVSEQRLETGSRQAPSEEEPVPELSVDAFELSLCSVTIGSTLARRKSASDDNIGVEDTVQPRVECVELSKEELEDQRVSSDSSYEEEDEEEEDAPFTLDIAYASDDEARAGDTGEAPASEDHRPEFPSVPSLPPERPARQLSQRVVGFLGKNTPPMSPEDARARAEKEKKKALHAQRRKTAQLQQYEAELMAFADDVQRSLGSDTESSSDVRASDMLESKFLSELLNLVGTNDRRGSNAEERTALADIVAEDALHEERGPSPPEPEHNLPGRPQQAPERPVRSIDSHALIIDGSSEVGEEEDVLGALNAAAEDVSSAVARTRQLPRTRSIVISRKLGSIGVGTLSDEATSTENTSCGSLEDGSIFDMDDIEEGEDDANIANDWRKSMRASRVLKAFRPPFSRLRSPYFYSPKDGTPNALELRSWLEYRARAEALLRKSERHETCCIGLVKFVHSKELRDPLLPSSPQGAHNPFLSPSTETRAEDKLLDQQLQREHMKKPPKLAFLGVPSRVNHITLRLLRDHSQSVHQMRQRILEAFVDCGKRFMLILLRCASKMGFSLMSSVKEALAREVYKDFDGVQTPEFKMRCLVELWNSPAVKQAYDTLFGAHASAERKDEVPAISFVFERMGVIVASGFETEEKDAMVLHLVSVGRVHSHILKVNDSELELVVFAELGDSQHRILPGITAAAILYLIDLGSPQLWKEILRFRSQFSERFRRKPTLVLLTGVSSFLQLAEKPQSLRHALPLYQGQAVQSQLIAYLDKQFTDGLPKVCTVFCSSTSDPVIMRQISKHVAQFASNFLQKRAKARREKEKPRANEHLGAQLRVRNPGRKAGKTISRLSMRVKGLDVRSTFSRQASGVDA